MRSDEIELAQPVKASHPFSHPASGARRLIFVGGPETTASRWLEQGAIYTVAEREHYLGDWRFRLREVPGFTFHHDVFRAVA